MKKLFFTTLLILLASGMIFAQNKTKIYVSDIEMGSGFRSSNATLVKSLLEKQLLEEQRFEIVTEDYLSDYILHCTLNSKKIESSTSSDGSRYYQASLNYTLSLTSSVDNSTIKTEIYTPGKGTLGSLSASTGDTQEEAFEGLSKLLINNIESFINESLPVWTDIKEIIVEKNKPKGVVIGAGKEMGVQKDRKIEVILQKEYGTTTLATIGVSEVANGYSICSASVSRKELKAITEALNSGKVLKVKVIVPSVTVGKMFGI